MPEAPIAIYNASLELVAYLENATAIGYKKRKGEVWPASFSLPADDPKNAECQDFYYAEIYDGDKRIELFRIILNGKSRVAGKPVIKYECKHVLLTLNDDTMVGEHNAGPGVTAALNYILGKQTVTHWQLGTQEFTQNFYHYWKDLSLLAALYTVPQRFLAAHRWTFDTTSHPWTLNLLEAPTTVSARIAYRKNMQQVDRKSDVRNLYTRLYPYGYGAGASQVDISGIDLAAKGRPGFTSGSTEFTVGETLTGASSSATAKVKSWHKIDGAWGDGDAEGVVFLTDVAGEFTDGEDLNGSVSGNNCATLDSSLECVYAEAVVTYGVITRKWEDQRYTIAANLYEAAEARVDEHAVPELAYTVGAADLCRLTKRGEFVLGDLVKVYDGPLGIDVDARIVSLSKKDVEGKPGDIDIQLGNKVEKFPDFGGIVYADDLDQVKDGTKWGRVLSTQILAGEILLSAVPGGTVGAFPSTPEIAGLYAGATHFGYHDGTNWITYMDNAGKADWNGIEGDNAHIHWDPAGGGSLDIKSANVEIEGTMTITAGVVGGFNVDPTEGLYIGTGATRVQMKPGVGIWCGATAIGGAPFSATNAGVLTAKSGTIGGFTISETALTGGLIQTAASGTRAQMMSVGDYAHWFTILNATGASVQVMDGRIYINSRTPNSAPKIDIDGGANDAATSTLYFALAPATIYLWEGGTLRGYDAAKIVALQYCELDLTVGSKVTGTLTTANIPSLAASKITSGTFDVARIPGLDASKIASGTFDTARLPQTISKAGLNLISSSGTLDLTAGTNIVCNQPVCINTVTRQGVAYLTINGTWAINVTLAHGKTGSDDYAAAYFNGDIRHIRLYD